VLLAPVLLAPVLLALPVAPTHHETSLVRCPGPCAVDQAGPVGSGVLL